MVRECCRWYTRFAEHGITRMNLNLSPQTFMEEHAAQEITGCLDRYGLQHGKIWLEMTELGRTGTAAPIPDQPVHGASVKRTGKRHVRQHEKDSMKKAGMGGGDSKGELPPLYGKAIW